MDRFAAASFLAVLSLLLAPIASAQDGPPPPAEGAAPRGPSPMGRAEQKIAKQFDANEDRRLDAAERKAARAWLKAERDRAREQEREGGRGPGSGRPGGPGGPGGFGGGRGIEPATPGPKVSREGVAPIEAPLYDAGTLRTLFLDFEGADWEAELADFVRTDIEVPATLTVDGQVLQDVGVSFRGATSFMFVPEGSKRSLNLTIDAVHGKQRLHGYSTLNLLNAHTDPSFLRTVLYLQIARQYVAAPQANFVKLVVNGESWGVYVNAQQFDRELLKDCFGSTKGTRWKVPGSPRGGGGLEYVGEDRAEYERRYEMKSDGGAKAWKALIALCRTLDETPLDGLEAALAPMLDVDETLRFLAVDNALVNNDGYWVRASDYSLFLDEHGRFHVLPHDANETLQPASRGPGGGRGGPGGGRRRGGAPEGGPPEGGPPPGEGRPDGVARGPQGYDLDPLVGLDDATKPLRSRLLSVPSLRQRYLEHVRDLATSWLDWKKLGPVVDGYRALLEKEVEADTRKLTSFAAFQQALGAASASEEGGQRRMPSLKEFADARRAYLLSIPEIAALPVEVSSEPPPKR